MLTQMTVARKITDSGHRHYLVWITRAGATACIEVEARNAEDAKRRAAAELLEAEAVLSAI